MQCNSELFTVILWFSFIFTDFGFRICDRALTVVEHLERHYSYRLSLSDLMGDDVSLCRKFYEIKGEYATRSPDMNIICHDFWEFDFTSSVRVPVRLLL